MRGPFVIDASVIVNAFNSTEAGHATSKALLVQMQAQGTPMIAPALLLPETAAAIRRGTGNPELARQFAHTLEHLPGLILEPLDRLLAQQASEAAAQYGLRGSDAVYVALAQRFACSLITLDREQHTRAASALATYTPEELVKHTG